MALQKPITNPSTGHVNNYWRLLVINIDARTGNVVLVLGGYATAAARAAGRAPDDHRDWQLGPSAFAALAGAPPSGERLYDAIASPCYALIKSARRAIVPGTVLDDETGTATLPDGTVYTADQVINIDGTPTVPSEFADAVDV